MRNFWKHLASLQLAIVLLVLLMCLVVACTLAQVHLGINGAVNVYMRSFIVWWGPQTATWEIPVAPGGATVGLLLLLNLTAAMFVRLERSWRKGGLWLSHIGLIVLFLGEFVAGSMQVETHMPIEIGQTVAFSEDSRHAELVFVEQGASENTVYAVSPKRLVAGGLIDDARLPLTAKVVQYLPNSELKTAPFLAAKSPATAGAGTEVLATPLPVSPSEEQNVTSAYVELLDKGKSLGTWLFSNNLLPQEVQVGGKVYEVAIRLRRVYMPFTLSLKEFHHDKYAGTEIPKNFSSLVRLKDPEKNEDRDVLIYMNHPLRYRGYTFFQASFGKGDTLSIFQVVQNPGWQIPYLACILVALGLAWHFLARMKKPVRSSV